MKTCTRHTGEVTVYNLGDQYSRFRALVGMADNYEFYNGDPIVFRVQGDGRLLYESQPARSGDVPQEVDVQYIDAKFISDNPIPKELDLATLAEWVRLLLEA